MSECKEESMNIWIKDKENRIPKHLLRNWKKGSKEWDRDTELTKELKLGQRNESKRRGWLCFIFLLG